MDPKWIHKSLLLEMWLLNLIHFRDQTVNRNKPFSDLPPVDLPRSLDMVIIVEHKTQCLCCGTCRSISVGKDGCHEGSWCGTRVDTRNQCPIRPRDA